MLLDLRKSCDIEYNYATSVGLMKDRLGGIKPLDEGNIRYYGANPDNYIDIDRNTHGLGLSEQLLGP